MMISALTISMFSTGRDIATITQLEVKCLLFSRVVRQITPYFLSVLNTKVSITHLENKCLLCFQGSETNVPTYFFSVLNTAI